jgi:hypothetical protein
LRRRPRIINKAAARLRPMPTSTIPIKLLSIVLFPRILGLVLLMFVGPLRGLKELGWGGNWGLSF